MIEDRFQDGAGIIEGETDPECEQAREEKNLFHPAARIEFALRTNIKDRDGD